MTEVKREVFTYIIMLDNGMYTSFREQRKKIIMNENGS
jgi:hypothetical protein